MASAAAADVERLVISQASAQLPVIKAYVDIVDAAGQPPSALAPADLSVVLGARGAQVVSVAPFASTGEGVAYVFLVDISKSISRAQFAEMKAAIQTWIDGTRPPERAAIATFGEDYRLLQDFTADKQKLTAVMDGLEPRDMHTRLYLALSQAVALDQRIDPGLPARRAIVVLSDGKDEGSALTADDVLVKLRASRLPIYTIGLSHLPQAEKQRYLDVLHRFSNVSGGLYQEADARGVAQLYAAIQQAILRVFVVGMACAGCAADGRSYPLEITLTEGPRVLRSAALDIFAVPDPALSLSPPPSWWRKSAVWEWLVAAVVLLAAAAFAIFRRKPAAQTSAPAEGAQSPLGIIEAALHGKPPDPPAGEGTPVRLTVVVGNDRGSSYELKLHEKAIIGRFPDCDVIVADPQVSNHHCELTLVSGRLVVHDLESTNNTYVNGVPVRGRQRLEPLDTILLGDTELRVHY
jgi:hypothetical protein